MERRPEQRNVSDTSRRRRRQSACASKRGLASLRHRFIRPSVRPSELRSAFFRVPGRQPSNLMLPKRPLLFNFEKLAINRSMAGLLLEVLPLRYTSLHVERIGRVASQVPICRRAFNAESAYDLYLRRANGWLYRSKRCTASPTLSPSPISRTFSNAYLPDIQ